MNLFEEIIGPANILIYLAGAFSLHFNGTVKQTAMLAA
jgi:hypothetical protein